MSRDLHVAQAIFGAMSRLLNRSLTLAALSAALVLATSAAAQPAQRSVSAAPASVASAVARPAQRTFPYGQCTFWAYQKRPFIVDQSILKTGARDWNADAWARNAKAAGFPIGRRPAVGAVAVWPADHLGVGKFGHVAYVEHVLSGGDYTVSEMNWNEQPQVHYRLVKPDRYVRFIYRLPATDEPRPHGTGVLTGLRAVSSGNEVRLTIALSGPATVLVNTTRPAAPAREEILSLVGTTTLSLAALAGPALVPGSYTIRALVLGSGGGYRYLAVRI
jgi:surface antigen